MRDEILVVKASNKKTGKHDSHGGEVSGHSGNKINVEEGMQP